MDRQADPSEPLQPGEPLHAQIAARVRREVHQGVYPPGARLPAEIDLARSFGVSRGTVRQALTALLSEGLLQTLAGRGTFVLDGSNQPRAGLIGIILPSVVRTRNPELIDGAEEVVRQAGYSLLLGISGDDRWLEADQVQRIAGQGASGLIVYTVDGGVDVPALRKMVDRGLPIVLIDRYLPDLGIDSVTMDNTGGGFLATQHLAQQGYRRIGYIGTDNVGTSSIVERMAGYRWAMHQYGLPHSAVLVCTDIQRLLAWPPQEPDKQRHNEEVLRGFLGRTERPEAAFVCNDYVAFQVVQVAESLGLRVPDDLALVGFDNVAYTDYFGVPLTTVEQPRREIGTTAASVLLERIAGRRQHVDRIVISTRLIVRRSSVPSVSREEGGSAYVSAHS